MRLPPLCVAGLLGALLLATAPVQAQAPTYRVYPQPIESPLHTAPAPPADARVLLTDPADAIASPYGWHDTDGLVGADHTTTEGNNAVAFLDADGDHRPDPGETADGGAALAFQFPLDTSNPEGSREARLAQAFYAVNVFHDVLYQYGFTEAAGNFQQNTYGRGGLGGDPVLIEAGAPGSASGPSIDIPADGSPMHLRLAGVGAPGRDAVFDAGLAFHELAHGLTNRLTGGPATTACLANAEAMGEGWSDWYGMMLTMQAGDTRATRRTFGTYVIGQAPTGPGVRPAPYTPDFAANPYTYQRTRTVPGGSSGVGFVWATLLWEVAWDLIDAHGFSADLYSADGGAGNQLALHLVTGALKLQPCSPGFVDGRDAVLAADDSLYGGAHTALLWHAFARRGLGYSASQGSSATNADNTEAFDLPPSVATAPAPAPLAIGLTAPAPNPATGPVQVAFTLPAGGPARLTLYDATGRTVAVVADGERPAGTHRVAADVRGLAPGAYVLRLEAAGQAVARRLVVAP